MLYTAARQWNIKDPTDRFFRHVELLENGCWQWTGKLEYNGYSRFSVREVRMLGHQFSYREFIGHLPSGMIIDHLCRNRGCVNPSHLEPVTYSENNLRGDSPCIARARHERARQLKLTSKEK